MSDERLGRDEASLLGRLLVAGDRDEPPPRTGKKMLLALGVGSTVSSAAGSASAGTAAIVIKWLAIGACAGASLSVASGALLDRARSAPSPSLDHSPATLEPPPIRPNATAPVAASPSLEPAPTAPPPASAAGHASPSLAPARARSRAPAASASAPAASGRGESDALLEEAEMIERVSGAVRNHDGARALTALHVYRSRFPHGKMAPEADVLEVEALLATGQRAAARAAARRFLSAYPDSPSAKRVKTLVQLP